MLDLSLLATEQRNTSSRELDSLSIPKVLELINEQDQLVPLAVKEQLPAVEKVVEELVSRFRRGGRLFLCGAGTSGRLSILEAAECPPTFSSPPELVQAIMAGAPGAVFEAVEGAEDSKKQGKIEARERQITAKDLVLGISASGRTPYVLGILEYARDLGAYTGMICSSYPKDLVVDMIIAPSTGPEVVTGSTRLKAASAAKMILNMITTTAMVSLGKVYGNLMVDLNPNSEKLIARATNIVMEITGCSPRKALALVNEAKNAKLAVVMYLKDVNKQEAKKLLLESHGSLRKIIGSRPSENYF